MPALPTIDGGDENSRAKVNALIDLVNSDLKNESDIQAIINAMRAELADAQAGTSNNVLMTAVRTRQAISALIATLEQAQSASSNNVLMTPTRTVDLIQARGLVASGDMTTAITGAVNAEKTDRTAAIGAAVSTEVASRNSAIADATNGLAEQTTTAPLWVSRPGDDPGEWTEAKAGGDPINRPSVETLPEVHAVDGRVLPRPAAGVAAWRRYLPLEANRVYAVRYKFRRAVAGTDPMGDGVTCGILWYNRDKVLIDESEVSTTSPEPGDGLQTVSGTFASSAGIADTTAPAGAVYCAPFFETFGSDGKTWLISTGVADITNAFSYAPDVDAVADRVTALESLDLGDRLDTVESALSSPKTVSFSTLAEALSGSVPVSAGGFRTLGHGDAFDRGGATYDREVSEPSHAMKAQISGNWFGVREIEINVLMHGVANDGSADAGPKITEAAAAAAAIGATLLIPPGDYLLDGDNAVGLSLTEFAHGDVSLKACLQIPCGLRVRTAGASTRFICTNLDPDETCGIAIREDGTAGSGHSQKTTQLDGFTLIASGSNGRYGVVAPRSANLRANKRPKYQLGHIHFAGATDDKTVLDNGWAVGILIGDTVGVKGHITGYGTFNPTIDPSGQHQSECFRVSAETGAYGVGVTMIVSTFWHGFCAGDGLEGFFLSNSEIINCFQGVIADNSGDEPGGFIDNVHVNAVREAFRFENRNRIHIGKIECYRSDDYYSDGSTAWYGLRLINSHADVGFMDVNVGGDFLAETAQRGIHADVDSTIRVTHWAARNCYRFAHLEGSVDCLVGDGQVNGLDAVMSLTDGANDIQGGNVRVRNGTLNHYFTNDGTALKTRLHFPQDALIQVRRTFAVQPDEAGEYVIKPRLTPRKLTVTPQEGSGAYTYDVILDRASAVDGDEATVRVVGSSSSNPTVRVCDNDDATPLTVVNDIGGGARKLGLYTYSADLNQWREIAVIDSEDSTY
ncbi:MAG: hypothetical protein AcusKO_29270 [Acuticoccus sp.]